jgi:hypothetical protein
VSCYVHHLHADLPKFWAWRSGWDRDMMYPIFILCVDTLWW